MRFTLLCWCAAQRHQKYIGQAPGARRSASLTRGTQIQLGRNTDPAADPAWELGWQPGTLPGAQMVGFVELSPIWSQAQVPGAQMLGFVELSHDLELDARICRTVARFGAGSWHSPKPSIWTCWELTL